MRLARQWDAPHVTMFHTVERLKSERQGEPVALTPAGERRAECEGLIAATCDRVCVATQHEREQLGRLYGISAGRMQVIPCGVDLRTFTPGSSAERQAARAALGLGDGAMLLAVGRLDPIKGADLLLESLARMRHAATLVLVGGNPDGDPELDRLRACAAELGLADRVRLPGAVPHELLTPLYRAADALVIASRYESFGLVAVEALACGTPVVASKVGGLPSVVRDDENGVLVPWRSSQAFAEQLDGLLDDPARLQRFRAAARPSVERFDWRRIGGAVQEVYQELAQPAREPACSCC
jgi:D-inositol-3-phosphate glycosyltransferase